jgi:hypothetical protein
MKFRPVDFVNDANLVFLSSHCSDLPEWVKQAELPIPPDGQVPDSQYGYRHESIRRFPCWTKVATFLSRAYFEIQKARFDKPTRNAIERKLSGFENQYAIDTSELKQSIQHVLAVPTGIQLARRLQNKVACGRCDMGLGDIIGSARELFGQGVDHPFVEEMSFNKPVRKVKKIIIQIIQGMPDGTEEEKEEKQEAKQAAAMLLTRPHREIQRDWGPVLNLAAHSPARVKKVASLLRQAGTQPEFDVRIGDVDYDRQQVIRNLPKLAAVSGLPVVRPDIVIPVADWETRLTNADPLSVRKLHAALVS